jgi:acetoin utilization deacetylase AcuC-like enzyme
VRPPGHHALPDRAGGFCFFNNLAITARYAMKTYGLRRVLIIDWDIHFGNGFRELFASDPSVLCFSSHDMLLYPFSGELEEVGVGPGAGYTVNIPLARTFEDEDVLHIYGELLAPVIRRYNPELVLVAAGFDGHRDDPIGRSRMTSRGYGNLTRTIIKMLPEAGNPPLLMTLEGGYNPRALTESVRETLTALMVPNPAAPPAKPSGPEVEALVARVREIHRPFGIWVE